MAIRRRPCAEISVESGNTLWGLAKLERMGPRRCSGGYHPFGIQKSERGDLKTALRLTIAKVLCAAILPIWLLLERGKLTTSALKDWGPR